MRKIAASVLIKFFMNGNELYHTTDDIYRMRETIFSNHKHIIYDLRGQEKHNFLIKHSCPESLQH